MKNFKLFKKFVGITIATFSISTAMPLLVLAVPLPNAVHIINDTDFQLNTFDTSASTTITASAGGQVTNFDVQPSYIDITLDNASDVTFNVATPGRFFRIIPQSGSNYTISPGCPATIGTWPPPIAR